MSTGPGPRSAPRSDPRPLGARRLAGATLILALLTGSPGALAAAPPPPIEPRVRVDLVSEARSVAPGTTFWVGVRQRIHPGWHTYWVNPGDSGEPMTIEWQLPPGLSAGPVAWPHPHRIPVGPAMSFGYTDEVRAPRPDHGVRRARARHVGHARGAGELARVREDLHPRGSAGLADAGRRPRVPRRRRSRAPRPGPAGGARAEPLAGVLRDHARDRHVHDAGPGASAGSASRTSGSTRCAGGPSSTRRPRRSTSPPEGCPSGRRAARCQRRWRRRSTASS